MNIFIIFMIIYILLGTVIAIYAAKARSTNAQESYFIGDRKIGWVITSLTYAATTYSSFMMVGLVGLSFATGIGAMMFELTYLFVTVLLLSTYGKKIWKMSQEKGFVSPMELFSHRYGKQTGMVGAFISFGALIPYTAAQIIGLSIIFQSFGIDYGMGVIVSACLICLWSVIGGLRSVALTDAIQGLFMLVIAILALVWSGHHFGGFELDSFPNKVWTPEFFINITLPWSFFALTNPQVVQRLFIIKDSHDFRKMVILFALVGVTYTLITCFIGFSAKYGFQQGLFPAIARKDEVIVGVISQATGYLGVFIALSIIFASISTSNSIILTLSSMFTRDVVQNKNSTVFGRFFIIIITIVVACFAYFRTSYIVDLSVATSRILMCFIPLFVDLFHIKKGGRVTGILTLGGGMIGALVIGKLGLSLSSIYILGLNFILYAIGIYIDSRNAVTMRLVQSKVKSRIS